MRSSPKKPRTGDILDNIRPSMKSRGRFSRPAWGGCALVLAFAPALAATPFSPQPLKVGPETPVNTYTTGIQQYATAAMDGHGNFVVVWQSYGQLDSADIFGQRFDANGAKVGTEFPVNTYTTGRQIRPAVAMDANGNFVVVWQSYHVNSGDVFGQRFDSTGTPQGAEFRVNTYTTNAQIKPSVSMDGAGNFVVVWTSYGQATPGFQGDVYGQRYSASGVPVGSEFPVNTYTTGDQRAADVAMNAAGHFIVTWTDYAMTSQRSIQAQRYDASGAAVGSNIQVDNGTTTQNPLIPRVTIDAADNVTMVWMSYLTPFGTGILGQHFDSTDTKVGPQFQANSYTGGFAAYPKVAASGGGKFVVAWQNNTLGNDDIWGRMYDRSGTAVSGEFLVNTYTTNSQSAAAIAARGTDQFVVSWDSYGQIQSNDVFAQRFLATSNLFTVTPCRVIDTRNATGPYGGPALAGGSVRTFVLGGQCGIPAGASAVSLNVTVTQSTGPGDVRLFAGGSTLPLVSTLNYGTGQTRANNATVTLGIGGDMSVRVDQAGGGTVQFIADVNGYFQ
jgi:hypothetical protein